MNNEYYKIRIDELEIDVIEQAELYYDMKD